LPPAGKVVLALAAAVAVAISLHLYAVQSSLKPSLLVYAPPSMQPLLDAAAREYERARGVSVSVVYGATGALISRISLVREGDALFTADHEYMVKAVEQGLVRGETVVVVSYTIPALIVPRGNPANITGLGDLAVKSVRIGIADPQVAPFGKLAVEILEKSGVYEEVKGKLLVFRDVGEAARQVALGLIDVAILPHTVHYAYRESTEIIWLKPSELPRITCQVAGVLALSKNPDLARDFISFVAEFTRSSREAFELGYIASPEDLPKLTPYQPGDLVFESACIGVAR